MPPPDCLVPYIREAGFGGPLQMRPFDYDMPLVSALGPGDGPGISGRASLDRRGEELCWGEADLAEAASLDDPGGRRPTGCPAAVCPLLHHDDDRKRLVPRQDQQHCLSEVGPAAAGL
ncbi:hypothetical protein PIB30_084167 [Stylosanthes scabra]|uniref:Uncharacterized protein n=1 Tax=Stylosanthes scabra TaxID=79078 RepID=A0ABU6YTV4_9FABA|nr:hypothetical protein [Stylosanthes scabra]